MVEAELGPATGTIEREAAMTMVVRHSPGSRRLTLGADKAYDVREFVDDLRDLNVTPHIAQNTTNRSSAIDARTTRHLGYAISQQKRKRTEEPFGWAKTIGGLGVEEPTKSQFHLHHFDLPRTSAKQNGGCH